MVFRSTFMACLITCLITTAVVADEGQDDLDRATDLKLQAKSMQDFDSVIRLCEQAIKKGLTADSAMFARDLLTATRFQKAERILQALGGNRRGRQWKALRDLAINDLDKILKTEKDYAETYLLKARLLILPDGDPEAAREAVDLALKLMNDPRGKSEAYLIRSKTQKQPKVALIDINQAIKLDASNLEAVRTRALLLIATKELDLAMADLKKVIQEDPEDPGVRITLAELLADQKNFDEAINLLEPLVDDQQTRIMGLRVRAGIHQMREAYDDAIDDINMILKENPSDLNSMLFRARIHYLKEDMAAARKDLNRVLRAAPNAAPALLLRSAIAADEEDYTQAILDIEKILEQAPEEISLKVQIAFYHLADDRPRKAIEVLSSVISADPNHAGALRARGDANLAIGKHAEAIKDFEVAIKVAPENSGLLNNLAWVLATSPDDKLRDGKRAIELATKACELTKFEQAHILSTLGSAHAETGDFDEAKKWAQKAVEAASAENKEQLQEELDSYESEKPWREKQEVVEKSWPPEKDTDSGDGEKK